MAVNVMGGMREVLRAADGSTTQASNTDLADERVMQLCRCDRFKPTLRRFAPPMRSLANSSI
jgi:hypothetical protein